MANNTETVLNKSWVAGPVLGAGTYGAPQVWLKQDEHGRIVDRVAIKDTEITRSYDTSKDGTANNVRKVPVEVLAPIFLQNRPGGNNVVRVRNWRQNASLEMLRIYSEFCPHGNLYGLIMDYHTRYRTANTAQGIPEAFCWHVFACLATVGLLMERGAVHRANIPTTHWSVITHGDMKPENIFLGANQGLDWQGYPTTKLGDWGLAQIYHNGFSDLGRGFLDDYQFSPPEMRAPAKGLLEGLTAAHQYPARRSTQSNVWAVGLQIWSLMQMQNGDSTMDKGKRDWKSTQNPTPFRVGANMKYSTQLRNLVMRCLRYLPHERPSFEEIYNEIFSDTISTRKAEVNRLRVAPPTDPGFHLFFQKERYPLQNMLWDEARQDPKFYNELMPPPTPPILSPNTANQPDAVDRIGEGSTIDFFPPLPQTAAGKASQKRKITNAWRAAEEKREKERKALEEQEALETFNRNGVWKKEALQGGKGPSLGPPDWSPLTPMDYQASPSKGKGKKRATVHDQMEGVEAQQEDVIARPVKAARRQGRERDRSANPGAPGSPGGQGWGTGTW